MNSFIKAALLGIASIILDENREYPFTIKCSKCDCVIELRDGFSKGLDIEVFNGDTLDANKESTISIRCKCGNSIVSSDY